MKLLRKFKKKIQSRPSQRQLLKEIRASLASYTELTNNKMNEYIELTKRLTQLQQLQGECIAKLMQDEVLDVTHFQKPPLRDLDDKKIAPPSSFHTAITQLPLLIAEKTYNTSHPDYDATSVRNYPGRVFNADAPSHNRVYQTMKPWMRKQNSLIEIVDSSLQSILDESLKELKTVPHAPLVFERKTFIENYLKELNTTYGAHYMAGWVNLEDALFLYWLVRTLKPKTIVQTGVCNGLSSAFMMLALAKNGLDGRLYAIDLPAIFNPKDPAWTVKEQVYGVLIPEGKQSGWMVPEAYHHHFEVECGDAKKLLPPLIDRLESVDLFYHDSDHTYHHMMFEFNEVKRKLSPGGLIVGDDISWNSSVWDFADQERVPSFNYKGSVGVAFL